VKSERVEEQKLKQNFATTEEHMSQNANAKRQIFLRFLVQTFLCVSFHCTTFFHHQMPNHKNVNASLFAFPMYKD
jgi:hypothetical protein